MRRFSFLAIPAFSLPLLLFVMSLHQNRIQSSAQEHYHHLDGLRGWAILLVILVHAGQGMVAVNAPGPSFRQTVNEIIVPDFLHRITEQASHGVQLFFLVSAVSLILSAGRDLKFDFPKYCFRRFLRIAPMFYIAIGVYLAIYGFAPRMFAPDGISWRDVLSTATFAHSWSHTAFNAVVPGGWSVGNEATFYAALPGLLWIVRRGGRGIMWCLAGAALLATQWFFHHRQEINHWGGYEYFSPMNQAPVFLLGMLAGLYIREAKSGHRNSRMLGIGSVLLFMAMVVALPQVDFETYLESHLAFGLLGAFLIPLIHACPTRFFTNKWIVSIGQRSFSIYLIHFALMGISHSIAGHIVGTYGIKFLTVYYALLTLSSAAVSVVTYRWIEEPFIRLGRKLAARADRSHHAVVATD